MNNLALSRLEDVLAPWPAQCGLYVVSGTIDLVPRVEEMLVRFLDAEAGIDKSPPIGPVFWMDSGNYFNAYQMAEMAKRRGIDPRKILRALRIARPFTAYQFQQMLDKVPQPAQDQIPLVVISDLMALFYDPEIQELDLKRAYREFLTKLMRLKRRAIVLALLIQREAPPNRDGLLPRILEIADHIHGRVRPLTNSKNISEIS